jgi:chromosome partitioning protein
MAKNEKVRGAKKIQRAPPKPRRRTQWLVISSGKGGSGKSTLTRNLAVFASHSGLKVATVDLDGQQSLTNWISVRPGGAPVFDNFTFPMSKVVSVFSRIDAMPELDLVIVDTPPGVDANAGEMRSLVKKADFVLIPTGQGASDIRSVTEWIRFVKREAKRCAFVMNLTSRKAGSFDRAKMALVQSGNICPFDIRHLESVRVSDEIGLGVLEMKGAIGAADFQGVWEFVVYEMGLVVDA